MISSDPPLPAPLLDSMNIVIYNLFASDLTNSMAHLCRANIKFRTVENLWFRTILCKWLIFHIYVFYVFYVNSPDSPDWIDLEKWSLRGDSMVS